MQLSDHFLASFFKVFTTGHVNMKSLEDDHVTMEVVDWSGMIRAAARTAFKLHGDAVAMVDDLDTEGIVYKGEKGKKRESRRKRGRK